MDMDRDNKARKAFKAALSHTQDEDLKQKIMARLNWAHDKAVNKVLSKMIYLVKEHIEMFTQNLFSIGGAFSGLDANENPVCQPKGNGWDGTLNI